MSRWWPLTLRGTGAVVLAAACFVVAQGAGLVELMYFGALLLAAVLAGLVSLHLARRGDVVLRSLTPDVAAVGRASVVRVRARVRSALPTAPGRWEDTLSAGVRGRAAGVFPALASGLRGDDDTVELAYRVEGVRRGRHDLGPLLVTATDPFGLARRRYRLGRPTPVVVSPQIAELSPLSPVSGESGGLRQTAHARLGEGADNLIARPYAPGDSMRRIHWRATAHRDELMVREEEQESSPEATVVLDRSARHWSAAAQLSPGADAGFETAVSMGVSATMRLVRDGYAVEVVDADGTALGEQIAGGEVADVEALASSLATLTARAGDDDPARIAGLFAGMPAGPVVVVTGAMAAHDVAALAPLSRQCALPVLLGVGADDETVDLARAQGFLAAGVAPGDDVAEAWRSAVERGHARVG